MKYLSLEYPDSQRPGFQQIIKEKNIKRIFDLVRSGHCASRAALVRTMHLSATTVSALVEELEVLGLIWETGPTMTLVPGRRPMNLRLNQSERLLAVFSLSRRGVQYTLFNLGCHIVERFFVDYPVGDEDTPDSGDDYARLFEDILLNRSKHFDKSRTIVIGVSFPGIYLEEEQAFSVRTAMNVSFSEASMRRLEERIGLPLFLANVSMCLAYAEKKCLDKRNGIGEETRDLLFINICDGVGAGIISEGSILTGPYNAAGELGHISIDFRGKPCRCGGRGCLEQYVSLNAILQNAREACEKASMPLPNTFSELAAQYLEGSAPIEEILDDVAEKLSAGIYTMVCATGIRRIVVGGGIEILGEKFLNKLLKPLQGRSLLAKNLRMTYALSGPDGDSIGIAHYFLDKAYTITIPGGK